MAYHHGDLRDVLLRAAAGDRAVRAIRETRGVVAAVSDAAILEAKAVVDGAGVGCEPASAASVAGVRQLRERNVIKRGDSVRVVPLSWNGGLRYPRLTKTGGGRGALDILLEPK